MIKEVIQDAINDQIAAEFYSAHLYLSMIAYFQSIDLPGAAHWMRVQYEEELTHALKMFDYLFERDGRAILKSFDAPPKEWDSPLDAFESAYRHEQHVTALIENIFRLARNEGDVATELFLQWFITEQVEEEASVKSVVQMLKKVDTSRGGLFMIDRELGRRSLTISEGEASGE